jgi:uncharacterized protein YlxW (UPF0749 family)
MGLGASQARLLMLTARKSDLELMIQFVSQARMQLSNATSALYTQGANQNLDPNSAATQQLQMRISAIQEADKRLEMESKRLDTQHDAVQTEIESVQKVIQKNIDMSFKMMG